MIRDYREALIWLLIANTSGDEYAVVSMELTTKELSRAEIRSAEKEAKQLFAEIEKRKINGEYLY